MRRRPAWLGMPMNGVNGARLLVQSLKAAGVDLIFTLSGNQILPILDACLDEGLRVVDTRHEAAAAHAADAYARLTGRPAVCLVTAGPGQSNALTALATAQIAESPLLLIGGGSELARAGRGAFQEMDQVALAAPVCKLSKLVESAAALPTRLAEAFRAMQGGRPGAAYLTVPVDVLEQRPGAVAAVTVSAFEPLQRRAEPAAAQRALDLLASARRPVVVGSPSMSWGRIGQLFRGFLNESGLPGLILESPRGLTDPGLHGGGAELRQADVVLLFAPQDFAAGYAATAVLAAQGKLIQVAPSEDEIGRNRSPDVGLVGDAEAILTQLQEMVSGGDCGWARHEPERRDWLQYLESQRAAARHRWARSALSDQIPLHPLRVCSEVSARLRPADVAAVDGGEFSQWARWALADGQRQVVLNGKIGMIGCAIPFALGARLARPEARVAAFLGDGTFGFHGFELDTALRHGLPFVVVVGNDAGWSAERHRQTELYGADRLVASELLPTRYDLVAEALGAAGELIERPEQLGPALDRALGSSRPTVLNVRIASVPSPAAAAG